MRKFRQLISTFFVTATFFATFALAQGNLTQIRDTISNPDGTPFNGTVVITWNGYSTTLSGTISPLSTSARIYNGALSVLLVPTTTAAANSFYQVVYSSSDGTTQWTETWVVPPSSNALSVAAVRQSSTSGTGTGSGSSGGTGTGSTQYATLPISQSQVTGLTSSLSSLSASVTQNSTNISTLQTSVTGLQTSLTALTATVNGLSQNSGSGSFNVAFVDAETPGGAINSTNSAFTLAQTPSPATSLDLYRNGLLQKVGVDYTLSGSALTFLPAAVPITGDTLQAFYRTAGSGGTVPAFSDEEIPGGTINGTNTAFTLAATPNPARSLELYKNGMLLLQGGDYTLSGSTVTFAAGAIPQSGDSLEASYRH